MARRDSGRNDVLAEAGDARFAFGKNWLSFLQVIDEARIREAERGLVEMLNLPSLDGMSFLDIGSGSGLSSLAARRLGARVHSFDYDPDSVACTAELRRRYYPDDVAWRVEAGSALDAEYLRSLGSFDIVYSWGVLHHTGRMWEALANAAIPVAPGGLLFVAIYNDQGWRSRAWARVKRLYCSGAIGRSVVRGLGFGFWFLRGLAADLVRLRSPRQRYAAYRSSRGMSMTHDWDDWLGGYPFEVARPEEIFRFYRERGFTLEGLRTYLGTTACNELVLRRGAD